MLRLVAYLPSGVQRFILDRDEILIGSDPECGICIPYAGVHQRHARLVRDGISNQLQIEDLGTRKGLLVNGVRLRTKLLEVLDEVRVGTIALLLEDVAPERPQPTSASADKISSSICLSPERMIEHLARVSEWVLSDSTSSSSLETIIIDFLEDSGGGVIFLFHGDLTCPSIKFVMATQAAWLGCGDQILLQVNSAMPSSPVPGLGDREGLLGEEEVWIAYRTLVALERNYLFVAAFPALRPTNWTPLAGLGTLADQLILGLVHHVGQYEPITFGGPRERPQELKFAPGWVPTQSRAIRRMLEELRAAVSLDLPLLLRGEGGVPTEALARTAHLSSPRASSPFFVVQCAGISANALEVELFGALLHGRSDLLVREGKLALANGGTLYLEDVDSLPLRLQDRLVRFLRNGEIETTPTYHSKVHDVRIIASSTKSLNTVVNTDSFRLDLAYRLSQLVVEIPPLRDRREDLPLLIQTAVNRTCHQSGKRIQGITVRAMEALTSHEYPGNLLELESIVRRLVYLCPNGRPIDETMLPSEIRGAKFRASRIDRVADLNLEKLVADCEASAIREALKRSDGNKSEAARLLGLSRNGLSMKIERLVGAKVANREAGDI